MIRVKSIANSNFFIAAMITLVSFVLVILFCDIKYEISDDFVVDAILSGAYTGQYNPHMLFSNILLGHFLVFLYAHTVSISWYFVYLIVLGVVSIFTVNYLCLKRNNKLVGILFALIVTVFFANDLFILPSFTKAASAVIAAGGFLLVEVLWETPEKKLSARSIVLIIIAFALMLSGSLLRFSCVYLVAPFVAIMFLLKIIPHRKTINIIKHVAKIAACCLLLLIGLFFFQFLNNAINDQHPEYRDYYAFNDIRVDITDTAKLEWKYYQEDFESLGLDGLDFIMFDSWSFTDNDNYPPDRLVEIGKIYKSVLYNSINPGLRAAESFSQPYYYTIPVFISCILLLLIASLIDKKSIGRILLCILGYFIMLGVFFYIGRSPYRIIYGLSFSLLVSIFSCVSIRDLPNKGLRNVLIILMVGLIGIHLPIYVKDNSFKELDYSEYILEADSIFTYSGEYVSSKYRYVMTAGDPYKNIIEHIENDPEHYYLCDFFSTIQTLYYYYTPWERLPLNYWNDNYSYLGGCTMGYPDNEKCWEENGINGLNPYKSFINDNVYVVDNYFIKYKLAYLRKHYYPNATVELVDEIDGFHIWRFYLEQKEK